MRAGNPEYERARLLMTHEANVAIAGAFDAGASQVLVNDSHGGFRNMPPDLLGARTQAIMGKLRYLSMMAGIDESGILAHTINGFAFARVFFNEEELGKAGIYGALAGEYGVPVAMASGDDVFISEHQPIACSSLQRHSHRRHRGLWRTPPSPPVCADRSDCSPHANQQPGFGRSVLPMPCATAP